MTKKREWNSEKRLWWVVVHLWLCCKHPWLALQSTPCDAFKSPIAPNTLVLIKNSINQCSNWTFENPSLENSDGPWSRWQCSKYHWAYLQSLEKETITTNQLQSTSVTMKTIRHNTTIAWVISIVLVYMDSCDCDDRTFILLSLSWCALPLSPDHWTIATASFPHLVSGFERCTQGRSLLQKGATASIGWEEQ